MKLPTFNSEDYQDHRTVALAVSMHHPNEGFDGYRFMFSINLKHKMITFPIGKCRPDESLVDGLIREMKEELGIILPTERIADPYCSFKKVYDFTGKPVNIHTNVFYIRDDYGEWICKRAVNKEPAKCGGIFLATFNDAIDIAKSTGLEVADCVTFFWKCLIEHDAE